MKNLTIVLLLIFFSCKKPDFYKEGQSVASQEFTSSLSTISVDSPEHYIPEDEGGWNTWYPSGRVGLFNAARIVSHTTVGTGLYNAYQGKVPTGTRVKIMSYDCLVANGIPGDTWDTAANNPITLSGAFDWLTIGGVQPTPLSIVTYSHGDVYLSRVKEEFYYENTDQRTGAVKGKVYSGYNYVWYGWGDNYKPTVIIPEEDGLYVIAVTLDYNKPNPKTSLLPIRVTGTTATTDTAAIDSNKANPATNYKAVIQRGKVKGVNISWEGNGYAYCIERSNDGVNWEMILRWFDGRNYFDQGGNRFSQYRIITRGQGRIPDNETIPFKVSTK